MKYTLLDDNNGRSLVQVRDNADHDFWIPREKYLAYVQQAINAVRAKKKNAVDIPPSTC
jgi:hypothetical protein